jgi:hypothetical protein
MIARIKAEVFAVSSAVLAVWAVGSIRPSILPRDNQEGCCSEDRSNVPQLRAPVFAFSTIRESITTPSFHVFSDPTGCLSIRRNHIRSVIVSPPLSDG